MLKTILFSLLVFTLSGCGTATPATSVPQVESIPNENFLSSIGIRVDTDVCKAPSISVPRKQFRNCPYLGEEILNREITVRAVQDFPVGEDDSEIFIGKNLHLEFFKNGKKLQIPPQSFRSSWTTDYLALGISFVDESHIYVQGTFTTEQPDKKIPYSYLNGGSYDNVYTYFYNGTTWSNLVPQDIVSDPDRLQLIASKEYLKFVNERGCYYDQSSDTFSANYKDSELVATVYFVDVVSLKLVQKKEYTCPIPSIF